MNKVFFTLAIVFSGVLFAQEGSIMISPKNFKNTILLKTDLISQTSLTVKFMNNNKVVKLLSFQEVSTDYFKIDLKDLEQNKTYVVKVYNAKNELLFTDEIIKSLKH
jgi:hypothetical protein